MDEDERTDGDGRTDADGRTRTDADGRTDGDGRTETDGPSRPVTACHTVHSYVVPAHADVTRTASRARPNRSS
jgi:hypothetical protein